MRNINQYSKQLLVIKTIFPGGAEQAFKLITDLLQYPKIHPVIRHVEKVGPYTYICHECIRILFFPYRFHYKVTLDTKVSENMVTMLTEIRKGIILSLRFSMQKIGTTDELTEEIQVSGPSVIRNIFMRKLKKVHTELHRNVKSIIDAKLSFPTLPQTKILWKSTYY